MADQFEVDSGDKAIIILQSLICYLREKNILTRADLAELKDRIDLRVSEAGSALPCETSKAVAAAHEMAGIEEFCGKRYGGKHRRYTSNISKPL